MTSSQNRAAFRACAALLALVLVCTVGVATPGTSHAADDTFVQTFDPGRFTAGLPGDADALRLREIMANTNKYALTTWYNTVKNASGALTGVNLDSQYGYGLAAAVTHGTAARLALVPLQHLQAHIPATSPGSTPTGPATASTRPRSG